MTPTDRPPASGPRSPSTPCEESVDAGGRPTTGPATTTWQIRPQPRGWLVEHPGGIAKIWVPSRWEAERFASTPPRFAEDVT